jgi:hypothetical protein
LELRFSGRKKMTQIQLNDREEIKKLISSGKKFEAIKKVRLLTGAGLVEGMKFVENLENTGGKSEDPANWNVPDRAPIVLSILDEIEIHGAVAIGKELPVILRLKDVHTLLAWKEYIGNIKTSETQKNWTPEELRKAKQELDFLLQEFHDYAVKEYLAIQNMEPRTKQIRERLIAIGKSSIQTLIEAIKDHKIAEIGRGQVAYALGEAGNLDAIGPLVEELSDDWFHRMPSGDIAMSLGKLNWKPDTDEMRAKYLIARLNGVGSIDEYKQDLRELGEIKSNQAIEVLIQTVKSYFESSPSLPDSNQYLIDELMSILGSHGGKRIIELLMTILNKNVEDFDGGIIHGFDNEKIDRKTREMATYSLRLIENKKDFK